MPRLMTVMTAMLACTWISVADAQGPRGGPPGGMRGGPSGGMRAGGSMSMRGPSAIRGPSMMRSPSMSIRSPLSTMRGPSMSSSPMRSPSSMMRGPSISLRSPLSARGYSGSSFSTRSSLYYSPLGLSIGPRLSYTRPSLSLRSPYYYSGRPSASSLYYSRIPSYSRYSYGSYLDDPYPYRNSYSYQPAVTLQYTQPYAAIAAVPAAPIVRPNAYPSSQYESAMPERGSLNTPANLENGPERLIGSLGRRDTDDIWMNFLAPHRVNELISSHDAAGIAGLLQHYDGVVANSNLAWVANLAGFAETRALLRQNMTPVTAAKIQEASIPLPVPVPEAEPVESLPTPASPVKDATSVEL